MNKIMLTLEDVNGRVLVQYSKQRGKRRGVIVAIDNGHIGWALCKKTDKFDNKQALNIALGRAIHTVDMSPDELANYYGEIPMSLNILAENMMIRSAKYF